MTRIKICGITNLADARYASGAGADFLGFVQHSGSPRHIESESARDIIAWVYGARPVGVFVNETAAIVNETCDRVGFEFVQLHGDETVSYCEDIDRPIIKVIRIGEDMNQDSLRSIMSEFEDVSEYFLLDTKTEAEYGGSGKSFDWSIPRDQSFVRPIFLAGGLNPENVAQAIARVSPFAVDVSSGLEESPGKKDFGKIDAFIHAVREVDA